MTSTLNCPWWKRWHHQRLRLADVETMWPALVMRAPDTNYARRAWASFTQQEGQEHWRCPCAAEVAAFFEQFHFLADAGVDDESADTELT